VHKQYTELAPTHALGNESLAETSTLRRAPILTIHLFFYSWARLSTLKIVKIVKSRLSSIFSQKIPKFFCTTPFEQGSHRTGDECASRRTFWGRDICRTMSDESSTKALLSCQKMADGPREMATEWSSYRRLRRSQDGILALHKEHHPKSHAIKIILQSSSQNNTYYQLRWRHGRAVRLGEGLMILDDRNLSAMPPRYRVRVRWFVSAFIAANTSIRVSKLRRST